MSRLIDADALIAQMEADAEQMEEPIAKMFTYAAIRDVKHAPTIELRCEECEAFDKTRLLIPQPERKKDTIQKFHDYQVEWLLSHCDLELEPQLEEWVVRFLHDTANCYMMEIDRKEGDTP